MFYPSTQWTLLFTVVVTAIPVGCGRARTGPDEGTGGMPSESGGANSATAGGTGSGGGTASGGDSGESPLQPTADCIHPEVVEDCDGDFCRIPPGCFIMGAPPEEFGRALRNSDQVQVTLTHAFWMGRTEVTRAQWADTGLATPQLVQLNGARECLDPDCPQGNATLYNMFTYLNRLSELQGLEACYLFEGEGCTGDVLQDTLVCPPIKINASSPYACEGYRLPMEAEWEYAARAGTTTSFPTGNITPQANAGDCLFDAALDAIGWYCMNSLDQAQRVALKPPNAWGLHDMHGNVLEYVNDLYNPFGYLNGPYGAGQGPLVNPTGSANAPNDISHSKDYQFRAERGGHHRSNAVPTNVSRRMSGPDYGSSSNLGFRVARTIFDSDN